MTDVSLVTSNRVVALVIEDEFAIEELLRETLQSHGFHVLSAPDGQAALLELQKVQPDIILLDLMMPSMNGWEFLEASRTLRGDVPVMVISGAMSAADRDKLHALGIGASVQKPFDLNLLVARALTLILGAKSQNERTDSSHGVTNADAESKLPSAGAAPAEGSFANASQSA